MGSALAAAEEALAALAAGDALGVRRSIEALAMCVEVLREAVADEEHATPADRRR